MRIFKSHPLLKLVNSYVEQTENLRLTPRRVPRFTAEKPNEEAVEARSRP